MSITFGMSRISWKERLRRCYFLATEALMDRALIEHVLLYSLEKFREKKIAYPYVRPAELKPGGLVPTKEHALHNTALVIFLEQQFPQDLKPYIRVRRNNELLSKNLHRFTLPSADGKDGLTNFREIFSSSSIEAHKQLLELDMALVAQRRHDKKDAFCYEFSHFHVMVDAVLDAIIEDYGIELRYLSKNLYEQGEDYASLLEQKFFEQFGMKTTVSGRRTAAIVAHRLLARRLTGLHFVYVGSSESRCLYKIHYDGTLSRVVLIPISSEDIEELSELHSLSKTELLKNYLLNGIEGEKAALLYIRNQKSAQALPPRDRKLRREISSLERWITTEQQIILPLPSATEKNPLEWNWIYRSTGQDTKSD